MYNNPSVVVVEKTKWENVCKHPAWCLEYTCSALVHFPSPLLNAGSLLVTPQDPANFNRRNSLILETLHLLSPSLPLCLLCKKNRLFVREASDTGQYQHLSQKEILGMIEFQEGRFQRGVGISSLTGQPL